MQSKCISTASEQHIFQLEKRFNEPAALYIERLLTELYSYQGSSQLHPGQQLFQEDKNDDLCH